VSKYHSKVAPAYSYLLASRCNDFTFGAEFGVPNTSKEFVAHADDIPCIFKNDGVFLGSPSTEQAKIIKEMVGEWATFAKSLKPSENSWKSGGPLMVFQQPQSGVLTNEEAKETPFQDFADRMELWDALYWQKKKEELPLLSKKNLLRALSHSDLRQ